MFRELHAVSHKYPPYATGGLAPYMERSLDGLGQACPQLRITLYTLNYPQEHPREERVRQNLMVIRPLFPKWLRQRFLHGERAFDGAGKWWFGAGLALFNVQVALRLLVWRVRSWRHGSLVSVHDWQSAPVGLFGAVALRLPVVYHVHNTELTMTDAGKARDPFGIIRFFERCLGQFAAGIVVPSGEVKEMLEGEGWNTGKITVVPHGFEAPDHTRFVTQPLETRRRARLLLRQELSIPLGDPIIVFAGRLSETKGILTLIRALPKIQVTHAGVRLLVLGVGFPGTTETQIVRELVESLGLSGRAVIYDRYLPTWDVLTHFDTADVCVFPSIYEPFGLVSVEAMALTRPVVLGPGFTDSIALDESGPVAARTSADDPSELARAVIQLLDNKDAAAELAQRGERHVRASLTWAASTRKLLQLYNQVV